jgi:hypothetical protein
VFPKWVELRIILEVTGTFYILLNLMAMVINGVLVQGLTILAK